MSLYPLMLNGAAIRALVVGGGRVAARRTRGLLDTGATVRVVAAELSDDLKTLAGHDRLELLSPRSYTTGDLQDATLVVAATNDRDVNARVAADAKAAGRLVNVVDDPSCGTCVTPAVHRADGLVVAVSANGVPGAAVRVRSAIAARFDDRYAGALARLSALRRSLLDGGGADARARWRQAQDALVADDFCEAVEQGRFQSRVAEWG